MLANFTNIRIFFSKTEKAKYISHLDLNRTVSRIIKRSGLPVWFTEGFNPHIYATFALPLALGIEGLNESADLRLIGDNYNDDYYKEAVNTLNSVAPVGLRINLIAPPVRKASEIVKARYEIMFSEKAEAEKLKALLALPEIVIEKKTKTKTENLDIKPLLEVISEDLDNFKFEIILPAGNTGSINPLSLLKDLEAYNVTRTEALCADGEAFR